MNQSYLSAGFDESVFSEEIDKQDKLEHV